MTHFVSPSASHLVLTPSVPCLWLSLYADVQSSPLLGLPPLDPELDIPPAPQKLVIYRLKMEKEKKKKTPFATGHIKGS